MNTPSNLFSEHQKHQGNLTESRITILKIYGCKSRNWFLHALPHTIFFWSNAEVASRNINRLQEYFWTSSERSSPGIHCLLEILRSGQWKVYWSHKDGERGFYIWIVPAGTTKPHPSLVHCTCVCLQLPRWVLIPTYPTPMLFIPLHTS